MTQTLKAGELQATVYLWPNKNAGFGHISIEIRGGSTIGKDNVITSSRYISWAMKNSISDDKKKHGMDPIKITMPIAKGNMNDFKKTLENSIYSTSHSRYGKSYDFLSNNCAHSVEQILHMTGYISKKPIKLPGKTPYQVAKYSCELAIQLAEKNKNAILNTQSVELNDLVAAELNIIEAQQKHRVIKTCFKDLKHWDKIPELSEEEKNNIKLLLQGAQNRLNLEERARLAALFAELHHVIKQMELKSKTKAAEPLKDLTEALTQKIQNEEIIDIPGEITKLSKVLLPQNGKTPSEFLTQLQKILAELLALLHIKSNKTLCKKIDKHAIELPSKEPSARA